MHRNVFIHEIVLRIPILVQSENFSDKISPLMILYGVIINDCTIVVRYAVGAPLRPLVVTGIYNDPVYV
jgi:hypothetical protein